MNTITGLFYVFSAVLLFASFRVITARSTTRPSNTGAARAKHGKSADAAPRRAPRPRRSDDSEPARLDDVWATGSDGKPMTAALIARLVDRGLLRWDAPLPELLPALRPAMRPEYRAVTLAQLLSHRAGLPRDTADLAFFASFFADPRPLPEQRLAYVDRALREAPVAAPGGPANYSNTGFVLAGVIAEHVTGRSYEDLMQREVFTPLAMTSARFAPTHDGQPRGHRDGAPSTARFTAAEHGNPPMFAPAGAELHLTLRDWARFCADQLAGARGRGHRTLWKDDSLRTHVYPCRLCGLAGRRQTQYLPDLLGQYVGFVGHDSADEFSQWALCDCFAKPRFRKI